MKPGERFDHRALKAIERSLRERRSALTGTVRCAPIEPGTNEGGQPADPLESASNKAHDAIQVALLDCRHRQLAQIEAALWRLARGEYGICQACGDAIRLARLRALPFAQRCALCQSRVEVRARRAARPAAALVTP